jgi:hypothetical protein
MALPKGQSGYRLAFRKYKWNAKQRKIRFDLTAAEFTSIVSKDCHYCGANPIKRKDIGSVWMPPMNGIDRVDNGKGYFLENCVPCCSMCNRMKKDYYFSEFLEKVINIYKKWVSPYD